MAEERLWTVRQLAAHLGVNVETVRRWLRTGELKGILFGDRAGYRIAHSEVERFLAERQRHAEGKTAA